MPYEHLEGLVRTDHPDTAREAAAMVAPRIGTQRRKVYDFIASTGVAGATDIEIQTSLGMGGNTERPRRVELVDQGLISDSGRRRMHGGRRHIVWMTAPAASHG